MILDFRSSSWQIGRPTQRKRYTLSYSDILGKRASLRLQRLLAPNLLWNQERYARVLISYLEAKPGARWLEAGCGRRILPDGLIGLEGVAVGKAGCVVGMDVDWHGLRSHRCVDKRVCASLVEIPFADESFDVVGCNMVAEHVADPGRCMSELARVLKPEGILLIHTPNLHNYMVFLRHTLGNLLPRRWLLNVIQASEKRDADDIFPTLYRMNSRRRLQRLASDFGLETDALEFLSGQRPFFNFFLPLALVQILILRALTLPALRRFQSTILIALRKSAAADAAVNREGRRPDVVAVT